MSGIHDESQVTATYTFDTCLIRKICENPNFVNFLNYHIRFEHATVYINEQVAKEAQDKFGYEIDFISKYLRNSLGADICYADITDSMASDAQYRNRKNSVGISDNLILSFCIEMESVMVSLDKDLIALCKKLVVACVNPDTLHNKKLEIVQNRTSSWKTRTPKPEIVKTVSSKTKRPVRKITWEMFVA